MPLWKVLLAGALNAAAQTSSGALSSGADLRTTGAAAGVGALVGLLQALLSHPIGQHPIVQAAGILKPVPAAVHPVQETTGISTMPVIAPV